MVPVNEVLDGAKAKFSSPGYSYLDDPSPGDYFDSITSATKIMMGIFNKVFSLSVSDIARSVSKLEKRYKGI